MTAMDRRMMLGTVGAGALALWLGGCAGEAEAPAQPFFTRINKPIGLQLYALGDEVAEDIPGTFARMKQLGYGTFELPGLYGRDPAELRSMANDAGVTIASLHIPARAMVPGPAPTFADDPDTIAAIAEALGIDQLVIPIAPMPEGLPAIAGEGMRETIDRSFRSATLDHWNATAELFNQIGSAMKDRRLRLGFHNHNMEFAPLDGTTPFEVLMSQTDPDLVKFQLDIGWIATAGADPLALLGQLKGRVLSLHVKDVAADNQQGFDLAMSPTEVGSGTIDWAAVLPAAEAAGVEHYFVEQEAPFAMPREEAMAKSATYLKALVA